MKRHVHVIRSIPVLSFLAVLAACAGPQQQSAASAAHAAHYGTGGSTPMGGHPGGQTGSADAPRKAPGDVQAMCDMHRKMMQASPEEKRAMMGRQMSQEAMEKHMQMMREHCK